MINLQGQLAIKTIHGRNGDFNVGRLTAINSEFVVKDAALDQYAEGVYDGSFVVARIYPTSYFSGGRLVVEVRAQLEAMSLSGIDALSGDDAERLTPQEVDPIDEAAQTPVPAKAEAKSAEAPRSPRHPLVDTTPFGAEPSASAQDAANSEDAALFGPLWPLTDSFKLDATVDRRLLRQQRDRLNALGYTFDPTMQEWRQAA